MTSPRDLTESSEHDEYASSSASKRVPDASTESSNAREEDDHVESRRRDASISRDASFTKNFRDPKEEDRDASYVGQSLGPVKDGKMGDALPLGQSLIVVKDGKTGDASPVGQSLIPVNDGKAGDASPLGQSLGPVKDGKMGDALPLGPSLKFVKGGDALEASSAGQPLKPVKDGETGDASPLGQSLGPVKDGKTGDALPLGPSLKFVKGGDPLEASSVGQSLKPVNDGETDDASPVGQLFKHMKDKETVDASPVGQVFKPESGETHDALPLVESFRPTEEGQPREASPREQMLKPVSEHTRNALPIESFSTPEADESHGHAMSRHNASISRGALKLPLDDVSRVAKPLDVEDETTEHAMSRHNASISRGALVLPLETILRLKPMEEQAEDSTTNHGNQYHTTALSLLNASSAALRKIVGESLYDLLQNEPISEAGVLTKDEVDALVKLANSKYPQLRIQACQWIAQYSDSFPRGQLTTGQVLEKLNALSKSARDVNNDQQHILVFAYRCARALALEGETWAGRLNSNGWLADLGETLADPNASVDLSLAALDVCREMTARSISSAPLLDACMSCIDRFPDDIRVKELVCATLCQNQPAIEDESVLQFFLVVAHDAAANENYKLACDALRVVKAKSQLQAFMITQLFEELDVIATINTLYRSQMYGSKLQIASFLEDLITQLGSDVESKVRMCENGVIIRLVRLASPSAGASEDDGHQLAFGPAIRALTALAQVSRIGARIVLAGGLGPLFSHANSNRTTRGDAKLALKALGVSNLSNVVSAWIETTKKSNEVEKLEEPLEKVNLHDGSKLIMNSPPPNFFTQTVNDPESILGRGGFSCVFRANLKDGRTVAVKRLTKAAASDPSFSEEIRVLARVPPHPNIIGLLGVFLNEQECLIISELGGPTYSSQLAREPALDWLIRLRIMIGVAEGVRHLHSLDPCILHLDLKASNILLVGSDLIPKLCDFGLAVELKTGFEYLMPGAHGTIQYMAPECMRDDSIELSKGFDSGADVYSFGIMLWESANPGKVPWQDEKLETDNEVDITTAIRNAVLHGRRPTFPQPILKSLPPGYLALVENCWSPSSHGRARFVGNFFQDDEYLTRDASPRVVTTRAQGSRIANTTIGISLKHILWELRIASGAAPFVRQSSNFAKLQAQ